jgi:O-antigen ligase
VRTVGLVGGVLAIGVAIAWLPLPASAAAVAGAGLVGLILLHPVFGLLLLVPLIPFSPLVAIQVAGVRAGGMEALLALTLIAWLLRMAVKGQITVPRAPLMAPWLLWLGVMLLSWTQALSLGSALSETGKWLEMLAVYLVVTAIIKRRHLPWLLAAILAAGAAQAMLGLVQFLWRIGPEGFLIFDGGYLRAYGTFQQPNPYAGYLGLTLPLSFSLAVWGIESLHPRCREARLTWLWVSAAVATVLMLGAAYASQSRGAWLGIAAAMVAVAVASSRRAAAWFCGLVATATLVGALGAAQLLPSTILQRFTDVLPVMQIPNIATAEVTDANFPLIERLAHWQAALDMWRDAPWLGVGIGNYPVVYPAYAVGRWRDPLGHAHNIYLNIGAETGLVGLLAYVAFWLSVLWLAVRTIRLARGLWRAVAAGSLGVFVALSVHNSVDNLFVQGMYLHVAIVMGILAVLSTSSISECESTLDVARVVGT